MRRGKDRRFINKKTTFIAQHLINFNKSNVDDLNFFNEMLAIKPFSDLRKIFAEFERISGKSIEDLVKNKFQDINLQYVYLKMSKLLIVFLIQLKLNADVFKTN